MKRSAVGFLGQVVAWLVILAVAAALILAVLVPRLGGATPYTVLTGSMRPNCPPGTLIVAKPIDTDDVRVGDVVTIQLESGKGSYVTHRVVDITAELSGEQRFQTKGDANDVPDSELRRSEQIRGKLWYSVPYLGYVNNLLTGKQRQAAVYAVAAALLIYAGYMFISSIREPRSKPPIARIRKRR